MIEAYFPRTLIRWYNANCGSNIHRSTRLNGVLAFIDASGFTALTRRLGSHGREGSEILTRILNHFFEEIGAVVLRRNGDIFKFAGDALWAYFEKFPEPVVFLDEIMRAVDTVNASESEISSSPLTVHIGAEKGEFGLVTFGDPESRLEAEPVGALLESVYKACDIASANEIAIGSRLFEDAAFPEQYVDAGDGYFRAALPKKGLSTDSLHGRAAPEVIRHGRAILEKYVPGEVLSRLQSGDAEMSEFQSEHREVAVLFVNIRWSEKEIRLEFDESVNEKMRRIFEVIQSLGGSIARIDPFLPGHKLLVLFGAPVKREDDIARALKCARRLAEHSNSEFTIRCGLAHGALFCGEVGSSSRKEYTVMGEAVNMAARLMSKAEDGSILIDSVFRSQLPDVVRTETVHLKLKGVGESVPCFRFVEIAETGHLRDSGAVDELIGRDRELRILRRLLGGPDTATGSAIVVTGDAGVGKSSLLAAAAGYAAPESAITINCRDAILLGRGWLARTLLMQLLGCNNGDESDLISFVSEHTDERWLPLMGDILEWQLEDNPWTTGLSPELRSSKLEELFGDIFAKAAPDGCASILIDDVDKADELSRKLVLSCIGEPSRCRFVLSARDPLDNMSGKESIESLQLEAPSESDWWEYFARKCDLGKREVELFEQVLDSSEGNPLYVKDILAKLNSDGSLVKNAVTGKLELIETRLELTVPKNIYDLQLMRFDELEEADRSLLKTASVYPSDFSVSGLAALTKSDENMLSSRLKFLAGKGFVTAETDFNSLRFKHPILREAVYACVPESNLRELHSRAAKVLLESGFAGCKILAYHFVRSDEPSRGFEYALEAAKKAAHANSISDSMKFFEDCRRVLDVSDARAVESNLVFEFYREYVRSLVLNSKLSEAYSVCRKWRQFAKREGTTEQALDAGVETAHILWMESKYDRCRRVIGPVLRAAESGGLVRQRVKSYLVLAEVDRRSANFRQAELTIREAIKAMRDGDDRSTLVGAYNKLGLALWAQGRLAEAADSYRKSLEFCSESDGMYSRAQGSNNLAIILWELGNFNGATGKLNESLEIFRSIGDRRNEAYASGNLASLYIIQGRLKDAEMLFLQADQIFERLKDRHAHFYTIGNLGDIDVILGDLDKAEDRFTAAAEFAESVGDEELKAECGVRFGDVAFFRRDWNRADKLYREAEHLSESIGSVEYLTRARIGRARLMIGLKKPDEARPLIDLIEESAREEHKIVVENEARFLQGEYHRIRGDDTAAVDRFVRTLEYASAEGVFELRFKSAVRLFELDESRRTDMTREISDVADTFISDNDKDHWDVVLRSPYFSYFTSPEIGAIVFRNTSQTYTL